MSTFLDGPRKEKSGQGTPRSRTWQLCVNRGRDRLTAGRHLSHWAPALRLGARWALSQQQLRMACILRHLRPELPRLLRLSCPCPWVAACTHAWRSSPMPRASTSPRWRSSSWPTTPACQPCAPRERQQPRSDPIWPPATPSSASCAAANVPTHARRTAHTVAAGGSTRAPERAIVGHTLGRPSVLPVDLGQCQVQKRRHAGDALLPTKRRHGVNAEQPSQGLLGQPSLLAPAAQFETVHGATLFNTHKQGCNVLARMVDQCQCSSAMPPCRALNRFPRESGIQPCRGSVDIHGIARHRTDCSPSPNRLPKFGLRSSFAIQPTAAASLRLPTPHRRSELSRR